MAKLSADKVRAAANKINETLLSVMEELGIPEEDRSRFKKSAAGTFVSSLYHDEVDCPKAVGDFVGRFVKIAHTADAKYPSIGNAWVFIDIMAEAWKRYAELSGLETVDFLLIATEAFCQALMWRKSKDAKEFFDEAIEEIWKALEEAEKEEKELLDKGYSPEEAANLRSMAMHVGAEEVWNRGRSAVDAAMDAVNAIFSGPKEGDSIN